MWIANTAAGTITQLNPSDGSIKGTFRATGDPRFIAADTTGKVLVTSPPAVALTAAQAGLSDPCVGGTFDVTGAIARCTFSPGYYEFAIPGGVGQEYVQVYGAQGGSSTEDFFGAPRVAGGAGSYLAGMTAVTPGYAMLITVGGQAMAAMVTAAAAGQLTGTIAAAAVVAPAPAAALQAPRAATPAALAGGNQGGFGGGGGGGLPFSTPAARVASLLARRGREAASNSATSAVGIGGGTGGYAANYAADGTGSGTQPARAGRTSATAVAAAARESNAAGDWWRQLLRS